MVTAIEFALYPLRKVYTGWLMWPIERADEFLPAWRDWVEDVPDAVTSVGRLLQLPPLPEIPEPLRGRSFVVEAAFMGTEEDGAALIRPLRELGPEIDTFALVPASALSRLHMDPEHPELVPATLEPYAGRFIVRGGPRRGARGKVAAEPARRARVPERERARAWYESDAYRDAKALRQRTSKGSLLLVEGV